jgi:hypothetical protein
VLADAWQRHLGQCLLSRVLLHARLLRLTYAYVQFASCNRPIARLAREFTNIVESNHDVVVATTDKRDASRRGA